MAELLEEIGHNIRRLRDERGWNQTELGFHADTSPSIISLIENGKRNPSTATLMKIARALGVEVVDLFPKAPGRSPSEPSFNDVLEEERRPRYLNAWRAFVWKLEQRWKEEPPQTSREIAVVLDTMQALVNEGAFEQPQDQITASDWRTASEGIELQALFLGLRRLNAIADTVKGDETAQQRRELLQALPGGLSA
jgi:transcriptional regulator with XRE-family HTH domain